VGEETFEPKIGVQQGSCISPDLFAIYLQQAVEESPLLKQLAEDKCLFAFADDIMIVVDDKAQAE
jgi:hypothetical protein